MGRLTYNDDCYDAEGILAAGRWERNSRATVTSKRGQQVLRDLEAALLALDQKRLIHDSFYDPETDGVCALAAYGKYKGLTADQLRRLDDVDGNEQADTVSYRFGVAFTLAWNIIDLNDGSRHETPEARYERVLNWVRSNLKEAA